MKNYYQILGVGPEAKQPEIKQNYRKLSKKYHPDISDEENAEEKFKEITKAYEVLSSEDSRAKYDQKLKQSQQQFGQNNSQKRQTKRAQTNFSQGDFEQFEDKFKDFFGFDPQTKEKIKQDQEDKKAMDTDDLFNSFFGVDK